LNQDSSLSKVTSYGLNYQGFVLGRGKHYPLHYYGSTESGARRVSYPKDNAGAFPVGKADGAWNWLLNSI